MKNVENRAVDSLKNGLGGKLDRLVENKLTLGHDAAELNIYETFQRARLVELSFDAPVLTSMLIGKKVMHVDSLAPFDYLPGESLLLPAGKPMKIDFPEATAQTPTRCIALTLSKEFIDETVDTLNERFPRAEPTDRWQLDDNNYHLRNDAEMASLIERLMRLFRENNPFKQYFITLTLKELVIRLSQTQARTALLERTAAHLTSNRMAFIIDYIRQNLTRSLAVEELSERACLSKSHFFRLFKNELGMSPVQFILSERIRLAKQVLTNPLKSITDACYESGFNSVTHFSSAFRSVERMSPREYRRRMTMG